MEAVSLHADERLDTQMLRIFVALLRALPVLILAISVSTAQELPPTTDLQLRVAAKIPGYWSVENFRVVASENKGDPVSPAALLRFEADAVPSEDLFVATGDSIGPVTVVLRTYESGQSQTLYGTMVLTYKAGSWDGSALIENPVDQLGRPSGSFGAPTVELGSKRHEEILSAVISTAKRAIEDIVKKLKADHEIRSAELAATQDNLLAAMAANGEERLQAKKAEYEALVGDYETKIAEAVARFEAAVSEKTAGMAAAQIAEIKALKETHFAALRELREQQQNHLGQQEAKFESARAEHEAALQALREEGAAAIGALKATQAQELANLETGFEAKKAALLRQVRAADEIIAAQEELISKIDVASDNASLIEGLLKQKTTEKSAFFKAFMGNWSGDFACLRTSANPPSRYSELVTLSATSASTNGFTGKMLLGGAEMVASFVTDASKLTLPLALSMSLNKRIRDRDDNFYPTSVRVVLGEDMVLRGETSFKVSGWRGEFKCRVTLGIRPE